MGRILLLENDFDIAESIDEVLELDGHQTRRTASGKAALLWAAREPWDLVLLDIDADELSGLAVTRALTDFTSLPAVVLSASAGSWQRRAFAAGAVACMLKPFEVGELRGLVRTLIAAPRTLRPAGLAELSDEDLARVQALTPQQLDALPFGVIRVDDNGRIVEFNDYEAEAARLPRDQVVGRPFAEVAPCTQVQRFAGIMADGARARSLDRVLRFVFPTHGALSVVSVRLHFDAERNSTWIFVSRRAPIAADRRPAKRVPEVGDVPD